MLGLGESPGELTEVLKELRETGCSILTLGQYLRPGKKNLPVERYYHPDEFRKLREQALALGFRQVASGPLVRSSYHAGQFAGSCTE
jgi:lipoic acid synthetase